MKEPVVVTVASNEEITPGTFICIDTDGVVIYVGKLLDNEPPPAALPDFPDDDTIDTDPYGTRALGNTYVGPLMIPREPARKK